VGKGELARRGKGVYGQYEQQRYKKRCRQREGKGCRDDMNSKGIKRCSQSQRKVCKDDMNSKGIKRCRQSEGKVCRDDMNNKGIKKCRQSEECTVNELITENRIE
jgi:hypothetical protein